MNTSREIFCVEGWLAGRTYAQIAADLNVHPVRVGQIIHKAYRRRIGTGYPASFIGKNRDWLRDLWENGPNPWGDLVEVQ